MSRAHLATRAGSVRGHFPFTCPGLGDMLHQCRVGYSYHKYTGKPVTLHITADKYNRDKPEKWAEILGFFSEDELKIEVHNISTYNDVKWIEHLESKGLDVKTFYYGTHLGGPLEKINIEKIMDKCVDADEFLMYPELTPLDLSEVFVLPEKFITLQGVAANPKDSRCINPRDIEKLKEIYSEQGYEIIMLGAGNTDPRLEGPASLPIIAWIMSKSALHVGIDSGFLHFAELFKKPEQIHLYAKRRPEYFKNLLVPSHHIYRSVASGVKHTFMEDL
jgi:hypothetical protein